MSASGHHGGMGGHMGAMHEGHSPFMMLLKSADLTPSQQSQVHEILRSQKEQMKSVYRQFHAVHEQIADKLLASGSVSASDLAPLEQKAFRCQQQIDQGMVDTALAIRNILTPGQVSHLASVHQQLQSLHSQIQSIMGSDQDESADQAN